MSLSPHQIFGRLQELKRWQHTHEKLLQRSNTNNRSNSRSVNKIHSGNDEQMQMNSQQNLDEELIAAPLEKDFEELLEEKLNEYNGYNVPANNTSVPKRPFLKKGSGLSKYNLKPEEYKNLIGNKYSNSALPQKSRSKSVETKKKMVQFETERPKTTGNVSKTSRRPQNPVKPCRTSVNSAQRPKKTGTIDYARRNEIQNRQNKNKIVENSIQPQKVPIERKVNKNGDCSIEKSQTIKTNVRFHPEEPENRLKEMVKNPPTLQERSAVKELERDKFKTTKKSSPKLHDFIENILNKPAEYTPLKAPEISIKPRGNWCDASACDPQNEMWKNLSNDNSQKNDRIISNDKYTSQCAQVLVRSHWENGSNQVESNMPEIENTGDANERRDPPSRKSLSYTSNDNSLYERALETELKIFEALERRTEQSGFSSTNTSIIQLLASTPSKFNFKNSAVNTEDHVAGNMIDVEKTENLPAKDNLVHEFQDIISNYTDDFLKTNFKNRPSPQWNSEHEVESDKPQLEDSEEDYETEDETDKTVEEETSKNYEETNKNIEDHIKRRRDSSTNTDDFIILPSSYSSTNSDISEDYSIKTSKAYRSLKSPNKHKTVESSESCASCGFLIKNKIEECQSELDILKNEKNRIVAIREQMDKDKQEFEKEMKLRKIQFEEQKLKYQLEIEEEKRKMAEKSVPEKPNKDMKSKAQHRKDREEMNNLRMELSETKELMKLRETKNAMSIARLRNQIKVLEKSNAELKAENEKLIKEKSKLVVQQKNLSKTTETKMLKEISKNISKLTEETFKNQTFKVDTSSEDNWKRRSLKGGPSGESQQSLRKSSNCSQGILKNSTQSCNEHDGELIEDYAVKQNVGDSAIEEKYKSLFGGNDVIIEENRKNTSIGLINTTRSVGLGKSERILEDGTKEIKYTNGNLKRISENGTVRYYYSSNDTWHTNFPDGTEVIEFPNGQSEKRFKDGKCLIFFPDGLIQTIFPDGTEEVKYPDGSKLLTKKDGDRMLFLSNGQVEIHTKDQKRREYPDGTCKILYPDGSQETRYSNGRVRMKNSKGEIVLDTGESNL